MDVVIIGGGSAGTTCAFELRKHNKDINITIIEKTNNVQYSPCALPYLLSGEIKDSNDIYIFNEKDYQDNNINLKLETEVISINNKEKKLKLKSKDKLDDLTKDKLDDLSKDKLDDLNYDKLVIATGCKIYIPPIKGIEDVDYYTLKTIDDAKSILNDVNKNENAVIIGAGMVGVELAYSLLKLGMKVSIIDVNVLPFLDNDMSLIVKEYLESQGVKFYVGLVNEVSKENVHLENEKIVYDKLFLCGGLKPNLNLVKDIGLEINKGIIVDDYLQTSDKDIYACGDCIETKNYITNNFSLNQLGNLAVRNAKLIANNILFEPKRYMPVLNNAITKIGDMYIGSVGLSVINAKHNDIEVVNAKYSGSVKSEYYPSDSKIILKLVCDLEGIIIGCQIIGTEEVVGRLNSVALAIQKRMHLKDLIDMETCYNPASAPIFDPLSLVAETCLKKLDYINMR